MSSSLSSHIPKSQVPTHASRCPHPLVPVPLLYTAKDLNWRGTALQPNGEGSARLSLGMHSVNGLTGMFLDKVLTWRPITNLYRSIYSSTFKPCTRIERWVLRLQGYDFKAVYHPGKTNIADTLSLLNLDHVDHREENDYVRAIVEDCEKSCSCTFPRIFAAFSIWSRKKTFSVFLNFFFHLQFELVETSSLLSKNFSRK